MSWLPARPKGRRLVDGENVKIEYRWAHGAHERLPALLADLVRLRVAVIVPFGTANERCPRRISSRPCWPIFLSSFLAARPRRPGLWLLA